MNKKVKRILIWLAIIVAALAIGGFFIVNLMLKKQNRIVNLEAGEEYVLNENYGKKERTTKLTIELQKKGEVHVEVYDEAGKSLDEEDFKNSFQKEYHTKGDMIIKLRSEKEMQIRILKEYHFSLW